MVMKEIDCLIIGDILLDVFYKNENKKSALVRGGTSYCNSAKIEFGGAGNVASALSILGARAYFIGKAGDDLWGRLYNKDLKNKGVKTRVLFEEGATTGISFVVLGKNGERSFQVFKGANDALTIDEIDRMRNLIMKSEYLFFSGYSLAASSTIDTICYAVNLAKENNVKIVFDPGAHNLIRSNFSLFNKLMYLSDVFCPNVSEAKAMTQTNSLNVTIRKFKERAELTAIKCGAGGCFLINQKKCIKIPAFKTDCEDTTGAGDAFDAALIFGLINNMPLETTGQFANWFAAKIVQRTGARGFPAKKEITDFLEKTRV